MWSAVLIILNDNTIGKALELELRGSNIRGNNNTYRPHKTVNIIDKNS